MVSVSNLLVAACLCLGTCSKVAVASVFSAPVEVLYALGTTGCDAANAARITVDVEAFNCDSNQKRSMCAEAHSWTTYPTSTECVATGAPASTSVQEASFTCTQNSNNDWERFFCSVPKELENIVFGLQIEWYSDATCTQPQGYSDMVTDDSCVTFNGDSEEFTVSGNTVTRTSFSGVEDCSGASSSALSFDLDACTAIPGPPSSTVHIKASRVTSTLKNHLVNGNPFVIEFPDSSCSFANEHRLEVRVLASPDCYHQAFTPVSHQVSCSTGLGEVEFTTADCSGTATAVVDETDRLTCTVVGSASSQSFCSLPSNISSQQFGAKVLTYSDSACLSAARISFSKLDTCYVTEGVARKTVLSGGVYTIQTWNDPSNCNGSPDIEVAAAASSCVSTGGGEFVVVQAASASIATQVASAQAGSISTSAAAGITSANSFMMLLACLCLTCAVSL
eukprot:m.217659 g.217659  ORF g.217659 m.217659 type:complete len:450 (-) comp18674_c0_seq8:82-1431(-)